MATPKVDRIRDFYTGFKREKGYYPTQAAIAAGTGITRQGISKYFKKHAATLKKISFYKNEYFS